MVFGARPGPLSPRWAANGFSPFAIVDLKTGARPKSRAPVFTQASAFPFVWGMLNRARTVYPSLDAPDQAHQPVRTQMDEIVIDVIQLTKSYPSGGGIRDLTFRVERGELFVFLGPNGAGKSSTIKILTGLSAPDSGSAAVAGKDVARERLALKRLIGYMAEHPFLYEKLTGREFLRFMGDVFQVSREIRDKRTTELLRTFELADAADQLIETYSQGMRQKIALSGVLIHEPEVLFLDEPTNGLDPRSARIVKDVLRQICDRGATVFMTTHVLEVAEQMCDRVGILNEGRLATIGTVDELRERYRLPDASLEEIFLHLTGAAATPTINLYGHG
jgi:ABC-2 type transport system ATP-binding protein